MIISRLFEWANQQDEKMQAALFGALVGAFFGALVGAFFGALFGGALFGALFGGALFGALFGGALFGALFGTIGELLSGKLAFAALCPFAEWWVFVIAVVVISELAMLLFDKAKQQKGESKWAFIIKRKTESLAEWFFISIAVLEVAYVAGVTDWNSLLRTAATWLGYAGIAAVLLAIGAAFLWLNWKAHKGRREEAKKK